VPGLRHLPRDHLGERRLGVARRDARGLDARGEAQEGLQRLHAAARGALQVDVVRGQAAEHHAAALGPRDQHVQPPLPAIGREGAEAHGELPVLAARIADADQHRVALVALHVLQVLDEEGLVRVRREELFRVRLRAAQRLHGVQDRVALPEGEGGDAEALLRRLPRMGHDGLRDRLGLHPVDARTRLPSPVHADQREAEARRARARRGQDGQPPVVELGVGGGDQALVAAAVVPAQHHVRHAAGVREAEDALDLARRDGPVLERLLAPILAGHALEEAGWGHLPVVAHHHHLPGARDRAERVHRLDLAGLVDHEQVEAEPRLQAVRRGEELRDRRAATS
jgi:hypothetical protein